MAYNADLVGEAQSNPSTRSADCGLYFAIVFLWGLERWGDAEIIFVVDTVPGYQMVSTSNFDRTCQEMRELGKDGAWGWITSLGMGMGAELLVQKKRS